jgi:hypothetical protein
MQLIVRDRNDRLKSAGVKPGSFIKIFHGARSLTGAIGVVDYSKAGEESFLVYETKPELTEGSGIYFVKEDGYLTHLESDYG